MERSEIKMIEDFILVLVLLWLHFYFRCFLMERLRGLDPQLRA